MIHSSLNKKSYSIGEIHAKTDGRFPVEDLITSTVFGTMLYLPTCDAILIFKHIFGLELHGLNLEHSSKLNIGLWKKIKRIEPDIILEFEGKNTAGESLNFKVIVEVKWDATSSNVDEEHQLARQWEALEVEDQSSANHVYLTKYHNPLQYEKYTQTIKHRERLILVAWSDVRHRFRHPPDGLSPQAKEFCENMAGFLNREKIESFGGFYGLIDLPSIFSPSSPCILQFCNLSSNNKVPHATNVAFFTKGCEI